MSSNQDIYLNGEALDDLANKLKTKKNVIKKKIKLHKKINLKKWHLSIVPKNSKNFVQILH